MKKLSHILIYCSIVSIPFYFFRFSFLGIKTNIFEVGVLITLVIELINIKKVTGSQIKSGMTKWLSPLILLVIVLVSVIVSPDKERALGILKGWFLVPLLFAWLVTKTFNRENIGKIAIPFYISLLIISIWAILQKFGIISTLFYQSVDPSFNQYIINGRSFGPFDSPNFLAMYLTAATFLSLPIIELVKLKWIKITTLVSFILPVLALYFTGSRAGYITFFICLLLVINYRFINLQKTKNRRPFFTTLLVLLITIINVGYLYLSTYHYKSDNGSDKIRVEIYDYSTTLIQKHPVLGIGLGQFQSAIEEISQNNSSFQAYGLPYALHPHNLFLALWLNLGILGLITFIWIIVELFKGLYFNDSKYKSYFIAAAFAVLIHGLFDTTYFKNDLSAIFWLLFACSIILRHKDGRHSELVSESTQ